MQAFVNVIKKDSKVQDKINNILDRYMRLFNKYQSKIGYDKYTFNSKYYS